MSVWMARALLIFSFVAGNATAETLLGKVVSIADGDTITVLDADRHQHKIRIAGIDCPEKKQPFGQRAKERMSDLVFDRQVSVEWNKLDRYQRTIGKVVVGNKDAGLALIESGLAWHYKKYEKEQTPADRQRYAASEGIARQKRIGLWADENPVEPWEWRAEKRNKGKFK